MTAGKSTHIVEILEILFGLCCLFVVSPEATTNNKYNNNNND